MAALAPLTAEATVAPGEETEVTGLIRQDEEFARRFFTSPDTNRQPREIRLWITATAP